MVQSVLKTNSALELASMISAALMMQMLRVIDASGYNALTLMTVQWTGAIKENVAKLVLLLISVPKTYVFSISNVLPVSAIGSDATDRWRAQLQYRLLQLLDVTQS